MPQNPFRRQPNINDMMYPKGSKQPRQVWGAVMNVYKEPPSTTPTTPTPTPSITASPTVTPSQTPTGTPAVTPTSTNTGTPQPTTTPTPSPTPVTLLLDTYPALAAYSTRKLRTAYSGSALRVRRESDNVEQDIGFVGNELDTASLTSFLGSASGSVTKWYNQGTGGTTNDMVQTSAGGQPKIALTGTVYTGGTTNKPTIYFNGGNFLGLTGATMAFGTQNNATVFVVSQRTGGGTGQAIVAQGTTSYKLNFQQNLCQFDTGGGNVVGSYTGVFSAMTQGTFVRGNANKAFIRKVQSSTTNNTAASNLGSISVWIGDRNGNDLPLTGYVSEVIIYSSSQESNLTPISDSQINYYGA